MPVCALCGVARSHQQAQPPLSENRSHHRKHPGCGCMLTLTLSHTLKSAACHNGSSGRIGIRQVHQVLYGHVAFQVCAFNGGF
mmetsp:Transcript_8897/g.23607  ORF Transcript_8897/g.23607 Transcript_8897/m.23607 type:complete len:83 (-) Transcript_8897:986-1234(-)